MINKQNRVKKMAQEKVNELFENEIYFTFIIPHIYSFNFLTINELLAKNLKRKKRYIE